MKGVSVIDVKQAERSMTSAGKPIAVISQSGPPGRLSNVVRSTRKSDALRKRSFLH
jgi:hypothetical protein